MTPRSTRVRSPKTEWRAAGLRTDDLKTPRSNELPGKPGIQVFSIEPSISRSMLEVAFDLVVPESPKALLETP